VGGLPIPPRPPHPHEYEGWQRRQRSATFYAHGNARAFKPASLLAMREGIAAMHCLGHCQRWDTPRAWIVAGVLSRNEYTLA
jgi:hypothetical protein